MMRRQACRSLAVGVWVAGLPIAALAYCPAPGETLSWDHLVSSNLTFLLCLHDETVDTINNHADRLTLVSRELLRVGEEQVRLQNLAGLHDIEIVDNYIAATENNRELGVQIADLTARLSALEAQLAAQ